MSQHIGEAAGVRVVLGYDRVLDYVFCNIEVGGEMVYSNLDDDNAGTELQDVNYFRPIIASYGIVVPDRMFEAVEEDQDARAIPYTSSYTITYVKDGRS